jgi:hypothetical protein
VTAGTLWVVRGSSCLVLGPRFGVYGGWARHSEWLSCEMNCGILWRRITFYVIKPVCFLLILLCCAVWSALSNSWRRMQCLVHPKMPSTPSSVPWVISCIVRGCGFVTSPQRQSSINGVGKVVQNIAMCRWDFGMHRHSPFEFLAHKAFPGCRPLLHNTVAPEGSHKMLNSDLLTEKVILFHDNACPHTVHGTRTYGAVCPSTTQPEPYT